MPDWKQIIAEHHAWAHPPEDEFELVTQPPAKAHQLSKLEHRLKFTLPAELRSLYETYNGFGVVSENSSDDVFWFLRPAEQVPEFIDQICSWFTETHANVAALFFPFFDWSNGDGMGYLSSNDGTPMSGLYTFNHERYRFNEDQDVEEFLTSIPVGIEEFLQFRY